MIVLSLTDLVNCMPRVQRTKAELFINPINEIMVKYEITNYLRVCHFLSQIGHESESLLYAEEINSGANYEGRHDLGNIVAGDGVKYKGRGLIQVTGRSNYVAYSQFSGADCINNPAILTQPHYAVDTAGWFWKIHHLNLLADQDDILHVTRVVNGGTNGLIDRQTRLGICKQVLKQYNGIQN